jgi:hypothetical protein
MLRALLPFAKCTSQRSTVCAHMACAAPWSEFRRCIAGKMRRVLDLCRELGVAAAPACIAGVWIVPLLSWYHASWDREPDIPGAMPVNKVQPSWPRAWLAAFGHVSWFKFTDFIHTAFCKVAYVQVCLMPNYCR